MKMTIWGARGSIATPMTTPEFRARLREVLERSKGVKLDDEQALERFIERLPAHLNRVVSGNTSCIEVRVNGALFILDMGSGLRALGKRLMQEAFGRGQGEAHILLSHVHWDHVEGFPFFVPMYIRGNAFHFHTPFGDMEWRLRQVMQDPFFPVNLDYPQATRHYHQLEVGEACEVAGVRVEILPLQHPGTSYAYKLSYGGKTLVYANDAEYAQMDQESTSVYEDFYRGADVLIFDAMYTYEDAVSSKVDWGHSTPRSGAELAWRAKVKKLVLVHHDPELNDATLWGKVDDADQHLRHRNLRASEGHHYPEVLLGYEGLTLEL